jgi:hypothetical protein
MTVHCIPCLQINELEQIHWLYPGITRQPLEAILV